MCSRGRRSGLLAGAGILLLCLPLSGSAQARNQGAPAGVVPPEVIADLRAQLEEVSRKLTASQGRASRVEEAQQVEREALFRDRLDTARVGPFDVIGRADDFSRNLRVVEARWERFRDRAGHMEAVPHSGISLVVSENLADAILSLIEGPYRPIFPEEWTRVTPGRTPEGDQILASLLHSRLPQPTRRWAPASALHPDFDWGEAARATLLSGSPRIKDCLDGNDTVCLDLLEIPTSSAPHPDREAELQAAAAWITRVYPPEQWRELGRFSPACSPQRTLAVCLEALSGHQRLLRPLAPAAQGGLFRTALELGGSTALSRAMTLETEAPVAETLVAMGGAPLDVLLEEWRERILAADPSRSPSRRQGMPFLWTAAFGLLALTSSRWRT